MAELFLHYSTRFALLTFQEEGSGDKQVSEHETEILHIHPHNDTQNWMVKYVNALVLQNKAKPKSAAPAESGVTRRTEWLVFGEWDSY